MNKKRSVFIKRLWQVADPKIWIASVIPLMTGAVIAWTFGDQNKPFSMLWLLLAAVGVFLIEIAKNAFNEVNYQSGVDSDVDEQYRTPFSSGKKSILHGRLDLTQRSYIAVVCFMIAAVIGCILALFVDIRIFLLGLAGFVLAVIYSLPPFKLCYRGFGEMTVGIAFVPSLRWVYIC